MHITRMATLFVALFQEERHVKRGQIFSDKLDSGNFDWVLIISVRASFHIVLSISVLVLDDCLFLTGFL
jgi:hypothetical protein